MKEGEINDSSEMKKIANRPCDTGIALSKGGQYICIQAFRKGLWSKVQSSSALPYYMYVQRSTYIRARYLASRVEKPTLSFILLLLASFCSLVYISSVDMYSSSANIRVFLQIQWTSTSLRTVRYVLLTSCCFGSATCSLKRLRWAEWTPLRTLGEKQKYENKKQGNK